MLAFFQELFGSWISGNLITVESAASTWNKNELEERANVVGV